MYVVYVNIKEIDITWCSVCDITNIFYGDTSIFMLLDIYSEEINK